MGLLYSTAGQTAPQEVKYKSNNKNNKNGRRSENGKRSDNNVKRALLIGANYVNSGNRLYGCVNDVTNIRTFLLNYTPPLGYSAENITLMTDDITLTPNPSLLPTKENILAEMRRLVELTQEGDTLYIHYSGHGEQQYDPNRGSYLNGNDDCLLPISGGFIKDDELNQILVQQLKPGCNLIAFIDACQSGSILHLPIRLNLTQLSDPSYVVDNPAEFGQEDNKDIVMISGCRNDQGSGDTYEHRQAQGAFTWAVLSVFKHLQINKTPISSLSWKQLLILIRERLISHTYEQVPQLAFSSTVYLNSNCDL